MNIKPSIEFITKKIDRDKMSLKMATKIGSKLLPSPLEKGTKLTIWWILGTKVSYEIIN